MKKKFLTLILVGAMALSITACGGKETEETNNTPSQPTVEQNVEETVANDNQQETVVENEEVVENTEEAVENAEEAVENTEEAVENADKAVENTDEVALEGDAPLDDDVDSGTSGNECIDLTNTTVLNIGENMGYTLEMPVYTFAYSEKGSSFVSYMANNTDDNGNYLEFYQLSFAWDMQDINAEDAYARLEMFRKDFEIETVEKYELLGNASSKYMVLYAIDEKITNGTVYDITDRYYVYDSEVSTIYRIDLRVSKDFSLYGEDVFEKSTATYREELLNAMTALANN